MYRQDCIFMYGTEYEDVSDVDSHSAEVATSANYVRRFISSASAIIRCAVYCPGKRGREWMLGSIRDWKRGGLSTEPSRLLSGDWVFSADWVSIDYVARSSAGGARAVDSTARGLGSASISSFRRTAVCMYRSPTLTDCGAETLRFLQKFSQDSVCTVTKA